MAQLNAQAEKLRLYHAALQHIAELDDDEGEEAQRVAKQALDEAEEE